MAYLIDKGVCVSCGYCEFVCPFSAISYGEKCYEIDESNCKSCAQCFDACINGAIKADGLTKRIESVEILSENCIGCTLCQKFCPAHAVSGILKQPHSINKAKCIRCGVCLSKCKKNAISVIYR